MDSNIEVPFLSFLAGALLSKENIINLELSSLMVDFEFENNVSLREDDNGYNYKLISNLFRIDQEGLRLNYKYNDKININDKIMSVYDYLYSLTDEKVRKFFNIPDKKISETKVLKK